MLLLLLGVVLVESANLLQKGRESTACVSRRYIDVLRSKTEMANGKSKNELYGVRLELEVSL